MPQISQEIKVPSPDAIRLLWKALELGSVQLLDDGVTTQPAAVRFSVHVDGGETVHTITLYETGGFQMQTNILLGEKE